MRPLILALILIAACRPSPSPESPEPRSSEGVVQVGQDSVIQARVGQEFTIELRANATTGYSWALADSLQQGTLALVRDEYVADPAPAGMAGSGGRERWTFRALSPGETTIYMRYARSWEASSPAAETARFRVVIRP
jgi:inhibitor of cysteine peptidase